MVWLNANQLLENTVFFNQDVPDKVPDIEA
jgi:hypothetical protein